MKDIAPFMIASPLRWFLAGIWGYVLGAIPTGVLIAQAMRGKDVRQHGSGHTGGLNVLRVTGFWGGALTAIGDALLGVLAVLGVLLVFEAPWGAALAGVMAVVGHNWSAYIRFHGGIGLSTLTGALLYLAPGLALGALGLLIGFWLLLTQLLHVHRARATVLTMLVLGPLLWILGLSPPVVLLGVLGGGVVIIKTLPDWYRVYT
jgi:glycerol-3-phosphate acyltransferase PlsY